MLESDHRPPDWPATMRAKTLAEYLDIGSLTTLHRNLEKWENFPQKDPVTKRWLRKDVDMWLGARFGHTDPDDQRRKLNRELGLDD